MITNNMHRRKSAITVVIFIALTLLFEGCIQYNPLPINSFSSTKETKTTTPTIPTVFNSTSTITPAFLGLSTVIETTLEASPTQGNNSGKYACYQDSERAINDFLDFLHTGQYTKAAELYAGGYPFEAAHIFPETMNLDEKNAFISKFLEDWCNGFGTCLEHRLLDKSESNTEYVQFKVVLVNDDGSIYFPGTYSWDPSTGTMKKEVTGTEFVFRVERIDGCYQNIDIPPMTP